MATPCGVTQIVEMPSQRTFVTEIATALGMCAGDDVNAVISERPHEISNLSSDQWDQLHTLKTEGTFDVDFDAGFQNGRAFLNAPDALNGRVPRTVEWTGGRRPPGDEVVPSDLRIDHVYLVSCKYLSRILHNPSPARLFEGLLSQSRADDSSDWFGRVAPTEYQELYEACASEFDRDALPRRATDLTPAQRRLLKSGLQPAWPPGAEDAYTVLCTSVSLATAQRWRAQITRRNSEAVLWRLLRIGSVPYFILGASPRGSMRLRIDTPWDWRQSFRLLTLEISPQAGGQSLVGWSADYLVRSTEEEKTVEGHVEIRWSHGRFGQPPEAKVYLDTAHEDVPGYHQLYGVKVERDEASRQIHLRDNSDREERAQRLVQLMDLLPLEDELMAFSGQAAIWLFDDIKATWIYGYFTSTVLSAHAFCTLQIANAIRLLPDDPDLPEESQSLDDLAAIAITHELIDVVFQSHLVVLHDLHRSFTVATLHRHQTILERHIAESDTVSSEPPLLVDALHALTTAIECVRL